MATLTVTAFKWSGTHYNSTYDDSHEATFTDDDDSFEGSGDANEAVSIDGGAASTTWGSPYAIDVSFTDVDGDPHVETFYFFNTGGDWYFIPAQGSEFTEGATLGSYQSHTVGWDYATTACYCDGTLIETVKGLVAVEDLQAGDAIVTFDGQVQNLRLNLHTRLSPIELMANPSLRPIRIEAGALGQNLPVKTLRVSPQHRMLVSSVICQRMLKSHQALVAAVKLLTLPGVYRDDRLSALTYHHLVLDAHAIVVANGAPAESLYLGDATLDAIPAAALKELQQLFPDLGVPGFDPFPARTIPKPKTQKRLVERHLKNNKTVLSGLASRRQITTARQGA